MSTQPAKLDDQGFTLLETLVAFAIISLFVAAAFAVVTSAIGLTQRANALRAGEAALAEAVHQFRHTPAQSPAIQTAQTLVLPDGQILRVHITEVSAHGASLVLVARDRQRQ